MENVDVCRRSQRHGCVHVQIINIGTVYTISTETAAHSHHDKIRCACKYNAAFRAKIHAIIRSTFRATSYL